MVEARVVGVKFSPINNAFDISNIYFDLNHLYWQEINVVENETWKLENNFFTLYIPSSCHYVT